MISSATGEVAFEDGLTLSPEVELLSIYAPGGYRTARLSVPGWTQHFLGVHKADRGSFDVEVVTNAAHQIQTVYLSHEHPSYSADTPRDAERSCYHEAIIDFDLHGQRQHAWGRVFCRYHEQDKVDWLVIAYSFGLHVPLRPPETLQHLHDHAEAPESVDVDQRTTRVHSPRPCVP